MFMVEFLVHSWWQFSSSWFDFWFGKNFGPRLFRQFQYSSQTIDNQSTWWKFVDLEEIVPQTWYLNGEIVEA
jgi:hypothetical protein